MGLIMIMISYEGLLRFILVIQILKVKVTD
jgi:hypothetical protein